MLLLTMGINLFATVVVSIKHSDITMVLPIMEKAAFQVIFVVATLLHISESFTEDFKYC